MRIVSWNVAGLRACIKKGFFDVMRALDPDVICLQEIKATESQVDWELKDYDIVWNPAKKAGYAGTLIASRFPFEDMLIGFGCPEHEDEGRSITVGVEGIYLTTAYVPNSKEGLARLPYRLEWERDFQDYLQRLKRSKPTILCGDLNVAHEEIDIARPGANHYSPGFSDEERAAMTQLLDSGFVDTYRALHPDQEGAYTYWSYFGNARKNNTGWRLDYFLVSKSFMDCVVSSEICSDVMGSDHCPIVLDIE